MNTIKTIIVIALLVAAGGSLYAADGGDSQSADRVAYNKLTREVRRSEAALKVAYNAAVEEARNNGGKASLETKAKVLALQDEVDRKATRLLLIALRHGWEVPDFTAGQPSGGQAGKGKSAAKKDHKAVIFAPVDETIRTSLAKEAAAVAGEKAKEAIRLATKVRLPVISAR